MKTLSLWLGILACLVGGALLEGMDLETLWNAHLALLVFGPVAAYTIFFAGFDGMARFARNFWNGECDLEDLRLVRHVSAVGLFAGAFACLLFTIHALQTGGDFSVVARGLAVAFLGMLYGFLPLIFGFAAFQSSAPRLALVNLQAARDKKRAK